MLYQGIIGGGSSPVEPVDLSPVLLWTNPSPTSEFAGQKVELDLTDYSGIIVEFRYTNDVDFVCNRTYVKKVDILNKKLTDDSNAYFGGGCGYTSTSDSWASRGRIISSVDNTGVTFGSGGYANSVANSFIIPIKIYGVKEYVVEPVSSVTAEQKFFQASSNQTIYTLEKDYDLLMIDGSDNNSFIGYLNEGNFDRF